MSRLPGIRRLLGGNRAPRYEHGPVITIWSDDGQRRTDRTPRLIEYLSGRIGEFHLGAGTIAPTLVRGK